MSLTLDLNPAQERDLETLALSEGVPSRELAQQLFAAALRQKKSFAQVHAKAAAELTASGRNEDDVYAYGEQLVNQVRSAAHTQDAQLAAVFAYINAPKEEIDRLHAPEIARFDVELAEAATATPEEIAAAAAEWEGHKRRMNDHRAARGARLLFAEPVQIRSSTAGTG